MLVALRVPRRLPSALFCSTQAALLGSAHSVRPSDFRVQGSVGSVRQLHKDAGVNEHAEKTPITSQLWQMRQREAERDAADADSSLAHHTQQALTKTTDDSRLSLRYNFSTDSSLRDLYVDHLGGILIGKVFEDLDALAGNIANRHCDDHDPLTRRLSLVTASVDKIVQKGGIPVHADLVISGQVVWVGASSLDVVVEIHTAADVEGGGAGVGMGAGLIEGSESRVAFVSVPVSKEAVSLQPTLNDPQSRSRVLSSFFTYVARDGDSKAAAVPQLRLRGDEEALSLQRGQAAATRKRARKGGAEGGAGAGAGAQVEGKAMRRLVESGTAVEDMPALAPPGVVLMRHTGLENSVVCRPQNVNTSGRVFGGFIMHRAFDLALATSYLFAGAYPAFQQVDRISFQQPVDIGDLLRLKSRVVFSSSTASTSSAGTSPVTAHTSPIPDSPSSPLPLPLPYVVVEVSCSVVRPEQASSIVSNTFHFIFAFPTGAGGSGGGGESGGGGGCGGSVLRRVLPTTLEEAQALLAASAPGQSA